MTENWTPTGRWRHRHWRGRLVLQIEETRFDTYSAGGMVDGRDLVRWRDATISDVTVTNVRPTPEVVT